MKGLTISCKKAGELIEKKQVNGLSFYESFRLRTHVSMCKACQLYEQQSLFLTSLLKNEPKESIDFDENEVQKLKDKIGANLDDNEFLDID